MKGENKMGYFYVGAKTNQKINAKGKIGETNQKYISGRMGQIRKDEGNFFLLKYLEIPNSTSAMTKAIEGHARYMLEKEGYKHIQNDHFIWITTKEQKMIDYKIFSDKAIEYAKQYCDFMGISYIEHEGNSKARRTHKPRKNKRVA